MSGNNFIKDSEFLERYHKEVLPFWETRENVECTSSKNIKLKGIHFKQKSSKAPNILIVHGNQESFIKYKELSFELFKTGYSVWALDLRGHGYSDRECKDPQVCHVDDFLDYVEDIEHFLKELMLPNIKNKPFLFSHSMGALAATLHLIKYPERFKKAFISSPMYKMQTGKIPYKIAKIMGVTGTHILPFKYKYVPGHGPKYGPLTLEWSGTGVLARFEIYEKEFEEAFRERRHKGVSYGWFHSSAKAREILLSEWQNIKTPFMITSATKDTYVEPSAQKEFAEITKEYSTYKVYNGAKHEIYTERDTIRHEYLQDIANFLKD